MKRDDPQKAEKILGLILTTAFLIAMFIYAFVSMRDEMKRNSAAMDEARHQAMDDMRDALAR